LLKVACSGPGVSRTRNLSVPSPILYHYITAPTESTAMLLGDVVLSSYSEACRRGLSHIPTNYPPTEITNRYNAEVCSSILVHENVLNLLTAICQSKRFSQKKPSNSYLNPLEFKGSYSATSIISSWYTGR